MHDRGARGACFVLPFLKPLTTFEAATCVLLLLPSVLLPITLCSIVAVAVLIYAGELQILWVRGRGLRKFRCTP